MYQFLLPTCIPHISCFVLGLYAYFMHCASGCYLLGLSAYRVIHFASKTKILALSTANTTVSAVVSLNAQSVRSTGLRWCKSVVLTTFLCPYNFSLGFNQICGILNYEVIECQELPLVASACPLYREGREDRWFLVSSRRGSRHRSSAYTSGLECNLWF